MIVTSRPVPLKLPPSKTPRSPGLHVSRIISSIAMEPSVGILKQELIEDLSLTDVREITDPVAILRMCVGLAFEEWFIPQLPDVIDHPGEMCYDGVFMSPDGEELSILVFDGRRAYRHYIIETKATWKSINTVGELDGLKNWMWMAQLKSYCIAAGTTHAKLYVLFLCGDYVFPITPQLVEYTIEFEQVELEENWGLLSDYKNERMK